MTGGRPTRLPTVVHFAAISGVPLQDRVRRDDGGHLAQRLAPERPAQYREAPPLLRGKAHTPALALLAEHTVLLDAVGDDARLIAVDEAREREQQEAERPEVGHGAVITNELAEGKHSFEPAAYAKGS